MKAWLKASLILGVIGIILCIVAVVCGSSLDLNYLKEKISLDGKREINYDVESNNISDLKIKIGAANVKIMEGDSFKIEGKINKVSIVEKNNTLYIEDENKINIFGKNNNQIIVYVPNEYEFKNVEMEIGAGQIDIDKINIKNKFDLKIGGGLAILNNVLCEDAKIECGAGKIEGNISANNIDIECGAGNTELKLEGSKDEYNYDLDVGVGRIKVGDVTINSADKKEMRNTNENRSIKVDCGTGNVNIEFSK